MAATTHPMRNVVDAWLAKIELALKVRNELFGQYALEATQFFDGSHDFMWDKKYSNGPGGFLDKDASLPNFRITVNKLFEAVAQFGPALYAQNPNALVEAILPPEVPPEALGIDPNDPYGMQEYMQLAQQEAQRYATRQACASVKSTYLNWIQRETDKKTEARRAITEALVAGVGYLETVLHTPPGSQMVMPKSRYLSWVDVVFDPDAAYFEDVQWMAIRRVQPVNKAERRFGYERGTLQGRYQSFDSQPSKRAKKEAKQNRSGKSFDLLEYWEVFSKNGFGDLLFDDSAIPKLHAFDYSVLGDYCYIVCARDVPHPLNVPSEVLAANDADDLLQRTQWPVPFWYDDGGWPVSRLGFYEKPNCIWPISIFKPAIGELRFVNWCLSFLADKVAATCQTYVGILKEAGYEIQKQIAGKACPFTVVEIATALGKPLDQIVSFLQAPNFSIDIWNMIAQVLDLIDKRTGLTELIYGMTSTSMRSATEANVKNANVAVRPDDMAARTEDFLSEVEVREMQVARWFCEPQHVAPAVGQMGALLWQNYVLTDDVEQVVRGFDYRIEAGSARKPNKQNKIAQLTEFGQVIMPVLQQAVLAGQVEQWNAYVADIAKAMDLDPSRYMFPPPDPEAQGPSPEQQKVEADIQLKMADLELEIAKMQAELSMKREEHAMDLHREERRLAMEEESHKASLEHEQAEAKVKLQVTKDVGKARAKQAAKPKPKRNK
jgi:hypothetical protein